jgi:hypothetical protein
LGSFDIFEVLQSVATAGSAAPISGRRSATARRGDLEIPLRKAATWAVQAAPADPVARRLSRDIPFAVRIAVRPVVRTVARESLEHALVGVRDRFE